MSDNDQGNQQSEGGALREQLEAALAENKAMKSELTNLQRTTAFKDAGIDTSKGVGKLLAQTYDGELTADAIKEFAAENEIEIGGPAQGQQQQAEPQQGPDRAQQNMDQLRSQSQPDGSGQRMSHDEFLKLSESDPAAAMQAHRNGMVDVPARMAQQLNENRQATRLGAS